MTTPCATVLHARDNVATVLKDVNAGDMVRVQCGTTLVEITARDRIPLCHKIALSDLTSGDPVIKYGECVGEATIAILRGDCVHVHNMRSRRARPVRCA